jgi:hypothetical protein
LKNSQLALSLALFAVVLHLGVGYLLGAILKKTAVGILWQHLLVGERCGSDIKAEFE